MIYIYNGDISFIPFIFISLVKNVYDIKNFLLLTLKVGPKMILLSLLVFLNLKNVIK